MTSLLCYSPLLTHPPSGPIRISKFCFYSFTSATVGGLPTFCALWQPEKTQHFPQNKQPLRAVEVNSAARGFILSSRLASFKAAAATHTRHVPPTRSPVQSLNVWNWNSRDAFIIFFAARHSFKRATAWALLQKRHMITKSIGMLLLAIYLILVGITTLFHVAIGSIVMGVLALVTGILILVGK